MAKKSKSQVMSVKLECIHCQKPLDLARLQEAKIVIDRYHKIAETDVYLIFEIITIMQCQSCQKNNHILWEAKKMMSKEEVQEQEKQLREEYH